MKQDSLIVAETFYSIQGEGVSMGIPAVFLRLGGCNLLCEGRGWRCDTIEVWQKGKSTKFEEVLSGEKIMWLRESAHLVITGGEPLLQQESLIRYLRWFSVKYGFFPFVEIETNGTIQPCNLWSFVMQWNVSPKLSNSGESYDRRVHPIVLKKILSFGRDPWFKFVVDKHEDYIEISNDYEFLPKDRIILMPAGATQDELAITRPIVMELCKATGTRYCDRLHIVAWNKKTGV